VSRYTAPARAVACLAFGCLAAPLTVVTVPAAPALAAVAAAGPAEKAVGEVYQDALKADVLFGQGKYDEAAKGFDAALLKLINASKRYPDVANVEIKVGSKDLLTARALDIDIREVQKPGQATLMGSRFAELLEKMLRQALQVSGQDPGQNDDSILDWTVGAVQQIDPPVPDDQAANAAVRLKLAVAKLEGLFGRAPKLKKERVRGMTGQEALDAAKDRLAKVSAQAAEAAPALAAELPGSLKLSQETFFTEVDRAIAAAKKEGFIDDTKFDRYVADPSKFLQQQEQYYRREYEQAGKQMPANALDPVKAKIAELQKACEAAATRFSFPTNLVAAPAITNSVKNQLTRNIPGTKVLKIGLTPGGWSINKNEFGVPESRYQSGYVLYQFPGEKYARCSIFNYREDYAGGGRYNPGDGASSYAGTRWQKVP
jgi:hypothetical protein